MTDYGDSSRRYVALAVRAGDTPPLSSVRYARYRGTAGSRETEARFGVNVRNNSIATGGAAYGLAHLFNDGAHGYRVRADGAGTYALYDLPIGAYRLQEIEGGRAAWDITVTAASVTVTPLAGGTTGTGLYLVDGRIKSGDTPPPGARILAYVPASGGATSRDGFGDWTTAAAPPATLAKGTAWYLTSPGAYTLEAFAAGDEFALWSATDGAAIYPGTGRQVESLGNGIPLDLFAGDVVRLRATSATQLVYA